MLWTCIFYFFGSIFVAWWLVTFLLPRLRLSFLDLPKARSSHVHATPRGGGMAFVLVSCGISVMLLLSGQFSNISSLPLLALPLAIVGLFDDRYDLPALPRYISQFTVAVLIVSASPFIRSDGGLLIAIPVYISLYWVLAFFVTAVINFTNFMDGLDGLVAGCMSICVAVAAIQLDYPFVMIGLVGALVGFLIWNWSPAKIFMGDSGSTYLGAIYSGLVLQSSSWQNALSLLLVATPLLADSFFCLLRRFFAGQPVFTPHRLHLFQRLHQAGWSHAHVSGSYIFGVFVLSVACLFGGLPWVIGVAFCELLLGWWLDKNIAVSFFNGCL